MSRRCAAIANQVGFSAYSPSAVANCVTHSDLEAFFTGKISPFARTFAAGLLEIGDATMKQYKIFRHPAGPSEAVKQGWSWPGFFFAAIWALCKKMWALGLGTFGAFFVAGVILGATMGSNSDGAIDGIINLLAFVACIVYGANGNAWREQNLASRGFELVDTVTASNPEGAIALHLKGAQAKA